MPESLGPHHQLPAGAPTGDWPAPAQIPGERGESVVRALLRVERVEDGELRRLRQLLATHGGVEVERGDALLALFERPAAAVACALAHQSVLAVIAAGLPGPLGAGMAIHLGEVLLLRRGAEEVERGARPLEIAEGEAREVAARLGALAGGRILLTRNAFDLARAALPGRGEGEAGGSARWLAHGAYLIPELDEPLEVFEVGFEGLAPLAPPADSPVARRRVSPSEARLLGWRPALGQAIPRRPLFLLEERLGEGGFGEVWLARHPSGERAVFKLCFEADRLRALKREVTLFRLLRAALGHRQDIAPIRDWQFAEPPFFVESEYTDGGSLVRWAERQGGLPAVPMEERLRLAAEIAEALAAAHSVGVLHQDVKPENVLIRGDRDGRPHAVLADFGIGLLVGRDRLAAGGLTALGFTGTLEPGAAGRGTLAYLAPELVEGQAPTIQADLYAFGVLLYQLAAGDFARALAPGWERDVADLLLAEDIAALVDGQPERRPASAAEAAQRLRRLEARRAARAEQAARQQAFVRAQRRRRLATWAAAAATLALLIVSAMALREHRARRAAEAAEERASLRQRQAEDLIGFMLGDLRRRLEGVGRLELLDAVGEQAMAYFAAVPAAELSDEELARRSKALYQVGEVRVNQGRLPAARGAFEEAAALAAALVARDPQNEEWAFELAQGHFWLGQVDWNQRRFESARAEFEAYLAIAESCLARDGTQTRWRLEVAYASASLATVLADLGELDASERQLRRSITIKEDLVALEPGNLEWKASLANGLAWLASAMSARGRLAETGLLLQKELALRQELATREPANVQHQALLATARSQLGRALLQRGDLEGARREAARNLGVQERLAAGDPTHQERQRDLAVALRENAEILALDGLPTPARQQLSRAAAMLEALVARDPTQKEWERQLALTHIARADLELRQGRSAPAITHAKAALKLLEPRLEADPTNRRLRRFAALAGLALGRGFEQSGRAGEARRAWQKARAVFESLARDSRAFDDRDPWARLLLYLGDHEEALPVIEKLRADRYARPDFLELSPRWLPCGRSDLGDGAADLGPGGPSLFMDGFESGKATRWSLSLPAVPEN